MPNLSARKILFLSWLFLGALQSVACVAGAGELPEGYLLSSGPESSEAQEKPVRVPRSFFEGGLMGSLVVTGPDGITELARVDSSASWSETPVPEATPPPGSGVVLANFHDTRGCLVLAGLGGAGLCFQVMGDVASVGLNSREMQPVGLADWLDSRQLPGVPVSCGEPWRLSLALVSRGNEGFSVTYQARRCGAGPYRIQLKWSDSLRPNC